MSLAARDQGVRQPADVAPEGYSRWFLTPAQARQYEGRVYGADSYDSWVWERQQAYLESVLERRLAPDGIRYLDFACGAGRVTSFFEPRVAASTGVDISPAMLALAAERLSASRLICADGASSPEALDGPFDLVTAFRFFLNADDDLRHRALSAIHDVLSEDGVFVFNVHGNRWSMRSVGAGFRRHVLRTSTVNQMSFGEVQRLLGRHGFRIDEYRGFGLLVPRAHKLLGPRVSRPTESLVARFPVLNRFCVDLVFVCRKARAGRALTVRVSAPESAGRGDPPAPEPRRATAPTTTSRPAVGRGGPALTPPGRYCHVPYPWSAAVDTTSPGPAAFYAELIGQALRYGRPASRRPGFVWAMAGRHGIPERAIAGGLRRAPGRPRPDLDGLVATLRDRMDEFGLAPPEAIPERGVPSAALALERSAGTTVFVFDAAGTPLVVAKSPRGNGDGVEREARALQEVEAAAVAPRHLGRLDGWWLQEALSGAPLAPPPLGLDDVPDLPWNRDLAVLGSALCRVAEITSKPGPPGALAARVGAAADHPDLSVPVRAALAAAWRDVSRLGVSVLRHTDISPQNCLFEAGSLIGIVDWELADSRGAPGFDVWNAAIAYLESGLGLVSWSEPLALEAFRRSWPDSGYWREARAAGRRAAASAGVPDSMVDALEVVFFATRVGDHLEVRGLRRGTGIRTAIGMLEAVCAG